MSSRNEFKIEAPIGRGDKTKTITVEPYHGPKEGNWRVPYHGGEKIFKDKESVRNHYGVTDE